MRGFRGSMPKNAQCRVMIMVVTVCTICIFCATGCIRVQSEQSTITPSEISAILETPVLPEISTVSTISVVPAIVSVVPLIPTEAIQTRTSESQEYIVQPGDTLSGIASKFGVSLQSVLAINTIQDPDLLSVGQIILLPSAFAEQTPFNHILPDQMVVRGYAASQFDVRAFIDTQPGYIRIATDTVDGVVIPAADVVQRVSLEFSVDPRLLLTLLEYRAGWLSQIPQDEMALKFPIQLGLSADGIDRTGLYRQLAWAANQINSGYYGWKYRGLSLLELPDSTRLHIEPTLNAGTIGIYYVLSLLSDKRETWENAVSAQGLTKTYQHYFGEPDATKYDQVIANVSQPELELPFLPGEIWFFTGGPHGGWGSGSAWSAVDFAPPDERADSDPSCYTSQYPARAVATGIIARVDIGTVILDLDQDGNEATGWSILYLHLASDGRIDVGSFVEAGDVLGYPSCEGGVSTATHLHIARRYNGEWIPADCSRCEQHGLSMDMSGWVVYGFEEQEYQGYMMNGSDLREAEQGRNQPINRISW